VPQPEPERPAAGGSIDDLLAEIRRRADLGDYAGAAGQVAEGLRQAPQDPRLHFYDGLVHQARGQLAAAEDGFRRAAYLDAGFVMAQYHLGLVRLERGRADTGRRAIAAAAQIAGTLASNERLAEGAGLTAGDLRDSARLQLELRAPGARQG
jgi:chemotaxis protein methyltransferase CheR